MQIMYATLVEKPMTRARARTHAHNTDPRTHAHDEFHQSAKLHSTCMRTIAHYLWGHKTINGQLRQGRHGIIVLADDGDVILQRCSNKTSGEHEGVPLRGVHSDALVE